MTSDKKGIGIDLGTTTIVYEHGKSTGTIMNSQRKYGRDVISRIGCSLKEQGKKALMETVRKDLSDMLSDIPTDESIALAGNNVMICLLMGYDTEGFSHAPFYSGYEGSYKGQFMGHEAFFFPGIAPFVGGDITAGIYGLSIHEKEEMSLLIDLGTNGEMALGSKDRIYVASASAGPAFEGGRLGMYGSEVIDMICDLKESHVIDMYGTFTDDSYLESGYIYDKYTVLQDDIRDVQLAKGAVRAGVEVLMKEAGVDHEDIGTVYLSGNFGSNLLIEKAASIGLVPHELEKKTKMAGNTSLLGCSKLLAGGDPEEIKKIPGRATHVELANHGDFNDLFVSHMNF